MNYLDHPNNKASWQAKKGDASARDIVPLAAIYQLVDREAWAVCATEGEGWIACDHVRHTGDAIRAQGAIAVWVSDGHKAQCVWRAEICEWQRPEEGVTAGTEVSLEGGES